MNTSIIVPVHNALEYFQATYTELKKLTGVEIVVVDDFSHEDIKSILLPSTHYLRNKRQQLFTRTANRGLRYAYKHFHSDYFCVLNSDVVLKDGWLDAMLAVMESDPKIGVLGYRDDTPEGIDHPYTDLGPETFVTGHCLLLRRTMLEEIGVYCETDIDGRVYPEFGPFKGTAHIGSDRKLSDDAKRAGWKTGYCNAPLLGHCAGKSWNHNLGWLMNFHLDPLWPANDTIKEDVHYD